MKVGRDILRIHPDRVGRRDVKRQVARQLLEFVGASDEVGLAVQLQEHPDLSVVVQVAHDDALRGTLSDSLLGLGDALLPKDLGRLLELTARLLQRSLAIHHASAGSGSQLAHIFRGNRRACHGLQPGPVRGE